MIFSNFNKNRQFFLIFIGVLLFDQLTKRWAIVNHLATHNSGVAFGLFQDLEYLNWFLVISTVGVGTWLTISFITKYPILIAMFLGSVFSNLLDRFQHGGVIDWLPMPIVTVHNNFADWIIFLSLFILLLQSFKGDKVSLI